MNFRGRRQPEGWEWRWGREGLLVLAVLLVLVLLMGCTSGPRAQFFPISMGAAQTAVKLGRAGAMLVVDGHTQTVTVSPMGEGSVLVYPFDAIESIELLHANNPNGAKYVPVFDGKEDYALITTPTGVVVLELESMSHAVLLLAQTGIPVTSVEY